MSGLIWENITPNHAQDVGGQRRGRHIWGRHWRRFAEECGLAGPATVRRVVSVSERILSELPRAIEEVAALPTGEQWLNPLGAAISELAQLVRDHALSAGPDQPGPPHPTAASSHYEG
jgi:serine/threonine-protein kinase HipA